MLYLFIPTVVAVLGDTWDIDTNLDQLQPVLTDIFWSEDSLWDWPPAYRIHDLQVYYVRVWLLDTSRGCLLENLVKNSSECRKSPT